MAGPEAVLASPSPPSLPRLASLAVRGSTATLAFDIPRTPSGVYLYLSLDGNRILGRRMVPGGHLSLCLGSLSPGSHRLGYQTARADHIVLIDPVIVPVTIPGGSPADCQSERQVGGKG